MDLHGVQTYTPEDYAEKSSAIVEGASRRIVSVVKGAAPDEFAIVDLDGQDQEADFAFHLDAQNHLLAFLNFPNKLKPFLDSILGAAGASGSLEFAATNWEIGQRSRSGRDACSDSSMEKWVSRQKTKLEEWMSYRSFQLVKITIGEYNFETNRRLPTRYQVFFNQYVVKTVNLAKSKWYWRGGAYGRKFQGRALREAARQVWMELPEAPNLKPRRIKELTDEEKFDRRVRLYLKWFKKDRTFLETKGVDHVEFFMWLAAHMDNVATNTSLGGDTLTPDADESIVNDSVFQKLVSGKLSEEIEAIRNHVDEKIDKLEEVLYDRVEYAAQATQARNTLDSFDQQDIFSETCNSLKTLSPTNGTFLSACSQNIVAPRQWMDGEFVEHSNRIELKSDENISPPRPTGHFSENPQVVENKDSDQQDIFVPLQTFSDDLTDWKTEAEDIKPTLDPFEIVSQWSRQVAEKIPPATSAQKFSSAGCWDICWRMVTSKARISDAELHERCQSIIDGIFNLDTLKPVFIDWVMIRLERYRNGVPAPITDEKRAAFKSRLESFLTIPDG